MSDNSPIAILDVAPFDSEVAIFDDRRRMKKYAKEVTGFGDKMGCKADGMASMIYDKDGVVWFFIFIPPDASAGTVVHECCHMSDFILSSHGVPINLKNTEIKAYLTAHIFTGVNDLIEAARNGMD